MRAAVVIEASRPIRGRASWRSTSHHCPGSRRAHSRSWPSLGQGSGHHAKVFGWYDNEYGSYTNMLADLTVHVARACRDRLVLGDEQHHPSTVRNPP